jgi:hypothetical protein
MNVSLLDGRRNAEVVGVFKKVLWALAWKSFVQALGRPI